MSKPVPEHLDALNRPINVGDFVVTLLPCYNAGGQDRTMCAARVIGVTAKMIRVTPVDRDMDRSTVHERNSNAFPRYAKEVVLVSESEVSQYLLAKEV